MRGLSLWAMIILLITHRKSWVFAKPSCLHAWVWPAVTAKQEGSRAITFLHGLAPTRIMPHFHIVYQHSSEYCRRPRIPLLWSDIRRNDWEKFYLSPSGMIGWKQLWLIQRNWSPPVNCQSKAFCPKKLLIDRLIDDDTNSTGLLRMWKE